MRSYLDCYKDYCEWVVNKSGNDNYSYENLLREYGETTTHSILYKSILELCYDKKDGLYYFCKFIVGDLLSIGYPKPFRYNLLLRKWDTLVKSYKKLCIKSARGHGKCLSGETLVTLENGTRKKLIDITEGEKIISLNKNNQQEIDTVKYMKYVGDKKSFKISLKSQKEIIVADTHKFLTIDGWKALKDIKINDYIATPKKIDINNNQTIDNRIAYLLGWIISEGRYNESIEIWQYNNEVLNYIKKVCDSLNVKSTICDNYIRVCNLDLKKTSVIKQLKYKNSYEKFIPEEMFSQPDYIKYIFLSSLFEGDGYLKYKEGGDYDVQYSSMSKQLIYDLHHLLLTLNIGSRIRKKIVKYKYKIPKDNTTYAYNLNIFRTDIKKLLNNLTFIFKNEKKEEIISHINNITHNPNIETYPKELCQKYIGKKLFYPISHNKLRKLIQKSQTPKKSTLRVENNIIELNKILHSNISWDKIIDIKEEDIIPMYDIQVEKNHTYIANDIYTHNTVFFSEILNIYDMFLFKHRRIIIISASQEQSNRILEEIRTIIENNEWLVSKKNDKKWANTTIGYNSGYILVAGISTEILGEHVDRIVLDDILRSDNKLSDQQIEDAIDMTLDPMLTNRRGQMILVGTIKSSTDVFATIEQRITDNPKVPWKMFKFPAILDYTKKITLAPDRFTWEQLMDKRLSMGPLKFAREFQLELFSRDTSLFPDNLIKPSKEKGKELTLLDKADKRPPNWVFVFACDVARSGSVSADYSVCIGLAYDTIKQTKQIVYFWRTKGLKITEQARQLAEISKKFNSPMFLVEMNNMGQDMIDELADTYNVFVETIFTGGMTSGRSVKKEELIRFLITSFEHEQIIIPRGNQITCEKMDILENELASFCAFTTPAGNEFYRGTGHDDCVLSLALVNRATQMISVPFAMGSYRDGQVIEQNTYGSLTKLDTTDETDLVKKIRCGIIK